MDKLISLQQAIDALRKMQTYKLFAGDDMLLIDQAEAQTELMMLPTVQPEQRWIPVTERLPEEPYGCLVTVWDTNPITMDEFENILPYFVGWDGEQWNDGDGEQCPFEVIAWMPLSEPWKGEEDEAD